MAETKHNLQLLVLKHGQKRVMVRRQRSYNLMLDTTSKYFPGIPRYLITLQTNQLNICGGYYVEITAEIWEDVVDLLNVVEVTRAEITLPIPPSPLYAQWPFPSLDNQPAPNQVNRQNSSYAPQKFYKYLQY
ncbi:hypothetical protein C8R48DRAFT_86922 [Suillus tomentosus]|nr:hypothetical protein C8R48DRAFT_86922 [Suillus tomentosus]